MRHEKFPQLTGLGVVNGIDLDQYAKIIELAALHVRKKAPMVEVGDLVAAGWMGLRQAAEKFDSARGLKFGTLAFHRVRGSMLDYLRSIDTVPRQARQRSKVGGPELVKFLEFSRLEYEDGSLPDLVARREAGPLEAGEDFERLCERISDERDRWVFRQYYGEERTMQEIGEALGMTLAGVCHIVGDVREGLGLSRNGPRKSGRGSEGRQVIRPRLVYDGPAPPLRKRGPRAHPRTLKRPTAKSKLSSEERSRICREAQRRRWARVRGELAEAC